MQYGEAARRERAARYYPKMPGIRNTEKSAVGKGRYYVWMIICTIMLAFIGVATHFMERCNAKLVFQGTLFKITIVSFLGFIISAIIALYKTTHVKKNRHLFLWRNFRLVSIIVLLFGALTIITITWAIWPAYEEASICFTSLFLIFVVNLGCLILYD